MTSLLQVTDLHVEFTGHGSIAKVLNGVDLVVQPAKMLGLVGESGSGKTILSLAAMGLLPPTAKVTSGDITSRGQSLLSMSERELRTLRGRHIAMIVPNPKLALNPVLRVGDQLANVFRFRENLPKKEAWARSIEVLESVGINDALRRADAYPHELSVGMAQRVVIAVAISSSPELLIADEPSGALDVTVQAQVLDLIKGQTTERNMAAIIATRDLGIVAQYCDEIAVLYAGQIVERASVGEFFESPLHPYSQELITAFSPTVDKTWKIHGRPPSPTNLPAGCFYQSRCPLVTPLCATVEPQLLRRFETEHFVRCHAYEVEVA